MNPFSDWTLRIINWFAGVTSDNNTSSQDTGNSDGGMSVVTFDSTTGENGSWDDSASALNAYDNSGQTAAGTPGSYSEANNWLGSVKLAISNAFSSLTNFVYTVLKLIIIIYLIKFLSDIFSSKK